MTYKYFLILASLVGSLNISAMSVQEAQAVLGLNNLTNPQALKDAYAQQVRKWHPDINQNPLATQRME